MQEVFSILTLGFHILIITGAECPPGFGCVGSDCYLIYPEDGDWKYQDPEEDTHDADENAYSNSSCYTFIRTTQREESCVDTKDECEQIGGNLTVINSEDEYKHLVNNVLHILTFGSKSTFNVYVEVSPKNNVDVGCAKIVVDDGILNWNDIYIENKECFTEENVDTIVCESSVVDRGICLVSTTDTSNSQLASLVTTTPSDLIVTSVSMISLMSTSSSDPMSTSKVPSKAYITYPIDVTRQTTLDHSQVTYIDGDNQNTNPNLLVPVGIPLLFCVVFVVIVTFMCCFIRYRKNKQLSKHEGSVSYSNGAIIHEHSDNQHSCVVENILYDTGIQLQATSDVQKDILKRRDEREMKHNSDNLQSATQSGSSRHNRNEDIEDDFGSSVSVECELYNAIDVGDVQHLQSNRDIETSQVNTPVFTQDGGEVYDILNVTDMQQEAQEKNAGDFPNGFDETLYANTEGFKDDCDVYDTLNAENMNLEPDGNNGKSDGEYDLPYSTINNHSEKNNGDRKGDIAVCEQNEYGKLNTPEKVPSEGMYAYVDTDLPLNLVEENAYDKLQRNMAL
ncbi:uncharacterized protein [Antedon mediterranea]|uniref:uncharacterized protein isoform X2 n=1 Tax=Antedon mediterranea TaxID=105859 RepID=UPI003AF7C05B